jgi:hypothetical protein
MWGGRFTVRIPCCGASFRLCLETGEIERGRIVPGDREHLRAWLTRFAGEEDVEFAVEGCTGWRYMVEELARAVALALSALAMCALVLPDSVPGL